MRVAVAMSGGVDSTVAVLRLREQGAEVFGMTLDLYRDDERDSCVAARAVQEAKVAAEELGIAHHVVDGRQRFEERVLGYAWQEYASGRTPNPCAVCNPQIKFGLLLQRALELGADAVATGHHARLEHHEGGVRLLRGRDAHKDQSYFLFAVPVASLQKARFPIGDLTKDEVRAIAREHGLSAVRGPESQDFCMAQQGDLSEMLRERFSGEARPGRILDSDGKVLGEHEGVHRYTVGQRKGLGVALGQRAYVIGIDAEQGDVTLGSDDELAAVGLIAERCNWLTDEVVEEQTTSIEVQIRYRHRAVGATVVRRAGGGAHVRFDVPIRAVTPGQGAVFYRGERLLGGGWIERALMPEAADDKAAVG